MAKPDTFQLAINKSPHTKSPCNQSLHGLFLLPMSVLLSYPIGIKVLVLIIRLVCCSPIPPNQSIPEVVSLDSVEVLGLTE